MEKLKNLKNLDDFISEQKNQYTLNESGIQITDDIFKKVEKKLSELEKLIKQRLGLQTKLKCKMQKDSIKIFTDDNSLIKSLGTTLVKTLFSDIQIDFWGGSIAKDDKNDKLFIWFNPKVSYEHPNGGSNSSDFIWRNLWFDIDGDKWNEDKILF